MMKKILCLVTVMLIFTGCGDSRTENVVVKSTEGVYQQSNFCKTARYAREEAGSKAERAETEEVLYDWQIELTEEMVQNLPDVPDWNSSNAYIAFLEGYKPSNEIVGIYKQKGEADELLAGYLNIYYQDEEVNYMPPYEENLYAFAMFKQGKDIVKGHQVGRSIIMTYPDNHIEEIDLDIIPEGCILLTTVSVYEGKYLQFFQGFSICYDQETSEAVCVRFDEEIGERVKISPKDIEEFLDREESIESYPFLSIGYINNNNELVYPTIVEDETGIRFELLKKALGDQKEQLIYFSSAIIDDINFKAYNNNVYIIDDVKRGVMLDGSQGFCHGIWTTGEAKIKEIPIDYSQLNDIEVELISYYGSKLEIEVCASMGDMTIFGKDTYVYQGKFKNAKFQKYLFDNGVDGYVYIRNSISINYDDWIEAQSNIDILKKIIIMQEEDNQAK